MTLNRRTWHLSLAMLIVAAQLGPGTAGAARPSGVRFHTSGGVIAAQSDAAVLHVPEQYKIVHLEELQDRVLVTAYSESGTSGGRPIYRSEVWSFAIDYSNEGAINFEDRQVLVALEAGDGEAKQLCMQTVSNAGATAVYVDGWEHGSTLLFDKHGAEIKVAWPTAKPGERCCVDFIRPIAWVDEWSPKYRSRLVCRMNDHGDDDPYLLIYDWQSRTFELLSMESILGGFGRDLVNSMLGQEGVY